MPRKTKQGPSMKKADTASGKKDTKQTILQMGKQQVSDEPPKKM